jgi:hypothetical protein
MDAGVCREDKQPGCRRANSIDYVDDRPVVVFVLGPGVLAICMAMEKSRTRTRLEEKCS